MTNNQYKALWDIKNDARTWIVVDAANDHDVGLLVASSFEEANILFELAVQHGTYPESSILVELIEDDTSN